MNKPEDKKDRNLIKGAIRRVFSRSSIRRSVLVSHILPNHEDLTRPRVKTWYRCAVCNKAFAAHELEVDHVIPIIPVNQTLDDLSWDELVERIWCDVANLSVLCKTDHKAKSKLENKQRREYKKGKNL